MRASSLSAVGLRFSEVSCLLRSTLGVCLGVASIISSDIRVCEEISSTTTPVASSFVAFDAGPGPTATLRWRRFPGGITVVVGFGVRQSFPFVVEPLGGTGRVSTVAPVRWRSACCRSCISRSCRLHVS